MATCQLCLITHRGAGQLCRPCYQAMRQHVPDLAKGLLKAAKRPARDVWEPPPQLPRRPRKAVERKKAPAPEPKRKSVYDWLRKPAL